MNAYVYLIGLTQYPNLMKIGKAKNVYARLTQLQTGCPFLLYVVLSIKTDDAFALESALHHRFRRYHIRNEWYDLDATCVDWIKGTYASSLSKHPSKTRR
jgi:hypothetical protein